MPPCVRLAVRLSLLLLATVSALGATFEPTGASVPGEVLVKFQPGASASDIAGLERANDVEQSSHVASLKTGTIWRMRGRGRSTEALVAALQRNPKVVYAEPNYIVRASAIPNDPSFPQLWGLKNTPGFPDIGAEAAWNVTTGSSDVVVGIVDSGVNYLHPDLAPNMWRNPGGKGNAACGAGTYGYNAINRTCDPMDDNYHGSHVAGTIGAAGNNNLGVAGINWTTSIMALKFLGAGGQGHIADAIVVIEFAVQAKIDGVNLRVLNNSWGGGPFSKALLDIINKASEHDILFVAAAGNDKADNDTTPHYPSSYVTPNMISVAATDMYDALATFSNYGVGTVHLGAPGVGILSTALGSGYTTANGTSMATPHVAGVAALLLAKSPSLTTAAVKSAILDSADPVPALNGKTITGRRLNAAKALGAAPIPTFTLAVSPNSRTIAPGTSAVYNVSVVPENGFTGTVALSAGTLPAGISASFDPPSTSSTSMMTVTVAEGVPYGFNELTITGTSGALTRMMWGSLTVGAVPTRTGCPSFAETVRYNFGAASGVTGGDFNGDGYADLVATNMSEHKVGVLLGNADFTFRSAVQYTVGSTPMGIAAGDFDADGQLDLVTANSGSTTVSVLLGNGNGTFANAVHHQGGASPFAVATADFNRDGRLDIAVANNGSSGVSILLGNGDGTFASAVHYPAASGPYSVAVGDLDRDGDVDLAVPAYHANRIAVLLNNGDGTFAGAVTYTAGTRPSAVAIGDFDRDGAPDLAVSNYESRNLSVLRGNGNGTFGAATQYATNGTTNFIAAADMNGDGILDLLSAAATPGGVSMHAGNGNGTFGPAESLASFGDPYHLFAGDLDGDGRPDLAVGDVYGGVAVVRNTSQCIFNCGTFAPGATFAAGADPDAIAAGDFNRDGRLDLAVTHDGVSIKLATGDGTFAAGVELTAGTDPDSLIAGDFNRDGKLDLAIANHGSNDVSIAHGNGDGTFQSAVTHAAGTNPRAIAASDFNGDGRIDLAVANGSSNDVTLLLGDSTQQLAAGTNPSALVAGDFDRDGDADLAVANSGSNDVSILLGDRTLQLAAGTAPSAIAAGDLNRDGALDLVVANGGSDDVSVLLGRGDGTFAAAVQLDAGASPSAVVIADFNRDGALDLAVTGSGSNDVALFAGNGRGSFAPALHLAAGTAPASLLALDVNRDGKPDLAVANGGTSTVSLLLNACPTPDLAVTKTHSGTFAQGALGRTYTITVTNAGAGASSGSVSVVDTLPVGLRATAISGNGWNCTLGTLTCTRNDALAAGAGYPAIAVTVDVAGNAAATVTNTATVSGGGDASPANNTATDPTPVAFVTDLVVTMTHGGSFQQGSTGRPYSIVARNAGGLPTSGTVTVSSTLPAALTATAMTGTGWSCNAGSLTCTRGDALAANGSFPPITLTVDVAANAPAEVVAMAAVSGGNQSNLWNDSASDPTTIWTSENCGGFGAATTLAVGSSPMALALGHFNADGKPDLAVVNYYGNNVSILLGNGDGTFAAAVNYPAGTNPRAVAVGDINGDGNVDVVTANGGSNDISVLLGNGNGTFAAATHHTTGASSPHSLVVGDLNRDGNLDVAATHSYEGSLSVFLGTGAALNPRVAYTTGSQASLTGLVAGDFDNDGLADLVAASEYSGVWRFGGNGDGSFRTGVRYEAGNASQHLAAGDFNRDGNLDLAVPNHSDGAVSVLLGVGNGTFQPPVTHRLNFGITYAKVVDINGDGHLDVLVSSTSAGVIYTMRGNGDGTFQAATSVAANSTTQFVTGEFNGDGRPDIAFLTSYFSTVGVMLGGCAELSIAKTHFGNFTAGQNHSYTITVSNTGKGSTVGTIAVTDVLPDGLTPVTMGGPGWVCTLASVTCTYAFTRPGNTTLPSITLNVNVTAGAKASITNVATVSGGGDVNPDNNSASDPTTVVLLADLTVRKSHVGNFAQGQTGRVYTIVVGNIGSAATTGTVTVTDTIPVGLTATAISGDGWTCTLASGTCTRQDALAIDATYPPITLTVSVSSTASSTVINSVTVSGGGDNTPGNNSASDWTTVLLTPTNLVATAFSGSVNLAWTNVFTATSYRVLRSTTQAGPYTLIGSPLANHYLDTTIAGNTTYFYRVQAVDTPANISAESNTATVTTPNAGFTDDPLVAGTTFVKAAHILELRAAVNALRAKGGLAAFPFTDDSLTGAWIKAVHLTELRTALDQGRAALGLAPLVYTDATPVIIRAAHILELRGGV